MIDKEEMIGIVVTSKTTNKAKGNGASLSVEKVNLLAGTTRRKRMIQSGHTSKTLIFPVGVR